MDPLDDRVWHPDCAVPPAADLRPITDHQHARFPLEQPAHRVGAQPPRLRYLLRGVMALERVHGRQLLGDQLHCDAAPLRLVGLESRSLIRVRYSVDLGPRLHFAFVVEPLTAVVMVFGIDPPDLPVLSRSAVSWVNERHNWSGRISPAFARNRIFFLLSVWVPVPEWMPVSAIDAARFVRVKFLVFLHSCFIPPILFFGVDGMDKRDRNSKGNRMNRLAVPSTPLSVPSVPSVPSGLSLLSLLGVDLKRDKTQFSISLKT